MARNDPLNYIRDFYHVPAFKHRIVLVWRGLGVITGANGPHVAIRVSGEPHPRFYHPDDVDFLEDVHQLFKQFSEGPRKGSGPKPGLLVVLPGREAPDPHAASARASSEPDSDTSAQWRDRHFT